jgi:hypothetical protein
MWLQPRAAPLPKAIPRTSFCRFFKGARCDKAFLIELKLILVIIVHKNEKGVNLSAHAFF